MVEEFRPDELRTHVANFLLLSNLPLRIQDIEANVSRSGISPSDLIWLLESDSENRFLIHRIGDDPVSVSVSRNTTTSSANDALMMGQIEKWRNNLTFLLMDIIEPVELSQIGSRLLQLPAMVKSVKIKLKDLILFDPLQRFQIIGEPPIFYVKRVLSDDERVECVMDWMEVIFDYLLEKGRYANLNEIASQFKRPFSLPKSIRLLDTLRNDTLNRFHFEGEGCDLRVKAIVDPVQAEQYVVIWRNSVANFLFKQGYQVRLSQIGAIVPRPIRLPGEYRLQDVLKSDPFKRFVMKGGVNHVMVKLLGSHYEKAVALDCADEVYKEDSDTASDGEWTQIVHKSSKFVPLKPKSQSAKSISQTKSNAFKTANILQSEHFEMGTTKEPCSVETKTPIGPPQLLQEKFIENKSSDYLSSLYNASNQMLGQNYFLSSVPNVQDSFNSFSATANDNWLNTQTSLSMPLTSLSAFVSPSPLKSENIEGDSYTNGNNTKWLELNHWLPLAFEGFDRDLVKGFVDHMRDDYGFVSTEDLYSSKLEGQLTFEALKEIVGFKIGHFNRLVKRLEQLGHSC